MARDLIRQSLYICSSSNKCGGILLKSSEKSKNRIWKRVIKIVSLIVVLVLVIGLMQRYVMCRLDAHERRIGGFYLEEKDSLDMIIVGSSETYNGFVPAKAYENYGITSYLYGFQAAPGSLWKYELEEIEREQSPDILVIECNGICYSDEDQSNPAEVRFLSDDMPLTKNKIQLVKEKGTESTLSYFLPLLKYHVHLVPGNGSISKFLMEKRGFNIMRGAQARVSGDIPDNDVIDVTGDESVADIDTQAEADLRAFLEQCQESDIKHIVFVRYPHVVTGFNYWRFQQYHRVKQIVEEYGFDYIDFDEYKDDIGLTFENDFLDCEHMNSFGAVKFTDFMTSYLIDKYNLTPREQTEKNTKTWEESVTYYNRLFEYWCYFKEVYPYTLDGDYDLNDNYESQKRIDAYFDGDPIEPE